MKAPTTSALKAAASAAAISLLACSACSTLPAQKTLPGRHEVIAMTGYRVSVPPGGGWQTTQDRDSGTVVFSKKWGGFLRWLTDEQRRIEIEVSSMDVPFGQWSMTDEQITSSVMSQYPHQVSGLGTTSEWEVLDRGGRKLHYLRAEGFVDGDEESTGLGSLNDEPNYKASSLRGLYFPPDLGKAHRYFEITLMITSIDTILPLHKDPERRTLEAVIEGLETLAPFDDTPGPTGALFRASVKGDVDGVRTAIQDGADINATPPDWTLLAVAAYYDRRKIVDLLATEEGDIDPIASRSGLTPLLAAIIADQPDVVALLLGKGAGVNERPEHGFPALMAAAALEDPSLVSSLVERGANVDARAEDGKTPLMIASRSGSTETARILLQSGAGADIQANDGETALMTAIDWGSSEIAGLLLESGADIDIRDDAGWTALLVAVFQGDPALVDELIGRGADIDVNIYGNGRTALLLALENDRFEIARTLIESGADVNRRKDGQWTALMTAVAKGRSDLVLLMIEKGADVNARSDDQQTALKIAEGGDETAIAGLLIKAGAKK